MKPTPDTSAQDAVIARIAEILAADERILAGWLVGSLGTGRADRHSDIDLHCLITDDSAPWFAENWPRTAADLLGPLVLTQDIPGTIGGLAITPGWLHLDLILHKESEYDPRSVAGLRPLYDRTGAVLPDRPAPKEFFGEPYFPQRAMELFLYFVGNIPIPFGRDELVLAHNSVTHFRQILADLMLAERGVRDRRRREAAERVPQRRATRHAGSSADRDDGVGPDRPGPARRHRRDPPSWPPAGRADRRDVAVRAGAGRAGFGPPAARRGVLTTRTFHADATPG